MNCKKCGKRIGNSWKFCIYCGYLIENNMKLPKIIEPKNTNNKIIKFLLSMFIILVGLILIICLIYLFIMKNS